jgi:hypothetical protein
MNGTARVSIIIVNWNTRDCLNTCLTSVHEVLSPADTQVIVVDNASADGSAKMVRDRFPSDLLVANETNRGFSGGLNDGLKHARAEYILILNPDIILRTGVVERLISYLDQHPDAGGVMPLLRNADGSVQRGYVRKLPSLMQVLLFATLLRRWTVRKPDLVDRYLEAPQGTGEVVEVEQIPGAFLLTARRVLNAIGPFDEAYRLFFEDVDWCYRAREKGLRLFMLPSLEVTHIGGRSFVVADGSGIQARFSVSMVTYFLQRKQKAKAAVAAAILSTNALLMIVKSNIFRGWGNAETYRLAAASRRTHWNVLRTFWKAFVLRRDEGPLL